MKPININDIEITSEMLSIISEIDEFKGAWKALGKLSPEKLKSLKKVATIESIGSSNRIEGNKLSDKQVEELLSNIDKTSFISRDEEEVAGYANLMETIFENWEVIPFSENHIKQLHKILLKYSTKDEKHRGEYKKLSNSVAAYDEKGTEMGIIFETNSPFETPQNMRELVTWMQNMIEDKVIHPLIAIGIFIVHFLAIHPFQDGNGRISRALTALLLLKSGYIYTPYCSIESIVENNKEGYYRALRATQATLQNEPVDYTPWLMFFLRTMQKHKIRLEYKIGNISSKNIELPILSSQIIELFNTRERLTISEIEKLLGANINTIKKHLKDLVNRKLLIKHGKTRGAWYTKE
jgi:Fic family protein